MPSYLQTSVELCVSSNRQLAGGNHCDDDDMLHTVLGVL